VNAAVISELHAVQDLESSLPQEASSVEKKRGAKRYFI
jgi:hypothetical protein